MRKDIAFVILRDGTGFVQCVIDKNTVGDPKFEDARQLTLETSLSITGEVKKDERQIGGVELQVSDLKIYEVAEDYPIAKKEHGVDFLMDHRHLWLRSKRQWHIIRIRNQIIQAIHQFFQQNGFIQGDAPIFTGNACEGTSTLFETEFYGQPAYLSQSGQLYGEAIAMAHSKIYTFGPTFRAEKSKTRRHMSEFWMIEPEMAFHNNDMNMDLIEEFIKFVIQRVLETCKEDLDAIERNTTLFEKIDQPFPRITYDHAVEILRGEVEINGKNALKTLALDLETAKKNREEKTADIEEREKKIKAGSMKKGEINFNQQKIADLSAEIKELEEMERNIPQWIDSAKNFTHGNDFGGSDETILTRLYETPIMVYNWPAEIKAFYMKEVEGNSKYVKGVDVLAPEGFGEIVGGGERETDLDLLINKIKEHKLPMDDFKWYLDLRRYGNVKHAGFGFGLERFVAWICDLHHIRETIPFPRMYGRLFP